MLSTHSFKFRFLLVAVLSLSAFNIYGQAITILDTLEYLPYYIDGALENNLMIAAAKGLDGEIERLISKGADIDGESIEGATPLIFAVANNRSKAVNVLLAYNPDLNKMTVNSETPLLISVKNQNPEITEALIRSGADIDLPDKFGATPIHYASLSGSIELVDLLLYYQADFNIKANDGTTPLMAAIWSGDPDITDLLFRHGANLEARDNEGFTPLLIAAQNGDTLIMNRLLKEGVDIYERNNYQYNALNLAIERNHTTAVKLLLDKGDKWTTPENEGVNPFSVASAFGRKDMIDILERYNIPGKQGLRIDEVTLSLSSKTDFRELIPGFSIAFREPLINAGFFAGYDFKLSPSRVLFENAENTYFQYFDKSSLAYAGIFKDFTISEYSSERKLILTTSISAAYGFGPAFKGTNIYPEKKISIIPSAGIKLQKNHLTYRGDLEYFDNEFYRIGPFWVRFSISYNHFLSRIRTPGKIIKWY
jgi:ankyrin repeat protein